jgi:multidrug efflux system outer membrane protein
MKKPLVAALIAPIALMTGCSLQPIFHRPDASVAAGYPSGEAYKDLAPGGTTLPAADIGWRDFMADPRLQRIVEIALANNRNLRVSALTVMQMQAQYRIQRAQLFPQVNAFAAASNSRTPGSLTTGGSSALTVHDYSVGLSVSWTLDFFGRLRSLRDQALWKYFSTAYARKAFEILLVSQVADQYVTMLAYDELMVVTRDTLKTAQDSYDIVKQQLDVGTTNEEFLRQAEGVLEQAKANYTGYVRLRAQAENFLVLLMGQPLPADLPPVVTLDNQKLLTDVPAGLPSDLLTRRPDIQEAEANLRADNANIGAARAAFFPTISLTADVGTASASLGGLFGAGSLAWSFAPQLLQPIFNAGANRAALDATKLQNDIDIANYQNTIQTAFREVADGLAARGTYDDQVASLQRYVVSQQRFLELAQMRYKQGVDPYLNVLTAQTSYYTARQALVSAQMARLAGLVDLYRALGGGWIQRTGDEPRAADVAAPREWSPTFSEGRKDVDSKKSCAWWSFGCRLGPR